VPFGLTNKDSPDSSIIW